MRSKTLKKGLSWLLCAAMLLTTAPVFAAPEDGGDEPVPKTVYVALNGNDTAGTGAKDTPFATLQKGLDALSDGDTLYIGEGTYTGEGVISDKDNITITGPDAGEAVLTAAGTQGIGLITANNCENLNITKLTINPTRGTAGEGVSPGFYYNAIQFNGCVAPQVSYCKIDGAGDGSGIYAIGNTTGAAIHHNVFSNTRGYSYGCNIATDGKIYNNIFASGERGIWLYNESNSNFIANNTFLNHVNGDFIYYNTLTTGNTFQNNIFASSTAIGEVGGKNDVVSVRDILEQNTFQNNLFRGISESDMIAKDADGTEVTFAEAAALDSFSGNLIDDPLFLDSTIGTIAKNSPCAGAGAAVDDITDDYDGTARANPPAIGAFEPSDEVKLDVYYVDAENGSDDNLGDEERPFQTVEKGIASLSNGKSLVIAAGTYELTGPVTVSASNVTIQGDSNGGTTFSKVFSNGGAALQINGSNNEIKHINFISDKASSSSTPFTIDANAADNLKIHDCTFSSDANVSIRFTGSSDVQIYNNVFTGTAESCIYVNGENSGSSIYNNLFQSGQRGVSLYNAANDNMIVSNTFVSNTVYDIGYYNATPQGNLIQNNILTKGFGELDNVKPMADFLNNNTFCNNLFHVTDGAAVIAQDGSNHQFTFDQAEALESFQNNLAADPNYVGGGDYSLADGSPAIDAGLAVDFVATDILGNSRDGLPDIGAYENQNAVSNFNTVSSAIPAAKQPLDEGIVISFTKPVDLTSLEGKITLVPASGGDALGVTVQAAGSSILITPNVALAADTAYQLTIAARVSAADGDILKTPYVRTFTTASAQAEDASLQIGTLKSSYGRAHTKVPALSGDYTISFDYYYPSADALNDFWVFAAYSEEVIKGVDRELSGGPLSPQIKQTGARMTFTLDGKGYNLPYSFQGDTWYHLTLKFENGTFSFYINGVKQTFSNGETELEYPEDQVINYIGYLGDLTGKSKVHDGMAYYDNFVIRQNGEVIFQEDFQSGKTLDQLDGWFSSPIGEQVVDEDWTNFVGVSAENNREPAEIVSISLQGENGRTGFMVGTSGNLTFQALDSNGNPVVLAGNLYEVVSKNTDILKMEEIEEGVFQATGVSAGDTEVVVKAILDGKYFEKTVPVLVTDTAELCNLIFADEFLTLLVGNSANPVIQTVKTDGSLESISVQGMTIESLHPDIAAAAADGDSLKVTGVAAGNTAIRLTLNSNGRNYTAELPVRVLTLDRIEASVNSTELYVGDTTSVSVTAYAADGTPIADSSLAISLSSDSDCVDVVEGKLVAKAVGSAKITVSAAFGDVTRTAEVSVNVNELDPAKERATIYTDEDRANARENIEKYGWASDIQQSAINSAETYLNMDNETLWGMVTSQMIPRSYAVTSPQTVGCLNCGSAVNDYGNYPYVIDSIGKPWKLTCPNCKMVFPTNDFEAYYEGGLDENGLFNPDLAKAHNDELIAQGEPGNLVNILYPEKGESWGVDDGTGYIAEDGQKYTFVAYYNHEGLWHGGAIVNALTALRDAYLYTGDVAYANKGVILLDRIADVYPDLDLDIWNYQDGYLNSNGNSNRGKAIGSIWETSLAQAFLEAYDAFYPALADDAEEPCTEALNFLATKNSGKANAARVRVNIEDGIVREIFPAVQRGEIRGNSGMHQATLAYAAVVLDSMPESQEWLDFDFQAGTTTAYAVTGGNISAELINSVDRDGHGNEGAPGYNSLWLGNYLEVADVLDGYTINGTEISYDLYDNVKFRKMFSSMYPLILSTDYSPSIGDTGTAGGKSLQVTLANMVKAFSKFGDTEYAQVAYLLNANSSDNIKLGIFDKDPEAIAAQIQNIIDTEGEIDLGATNLTGFGFTALRDGEPGTTVQVTGDEYVFSNLPHTESVLTKYFDSNSTLQLEASQEGDYIEFTFQSESAGSRVLYINMWTAGTYGIYDVYVNGTKLEDPLSFLGSGIQVRKAGTVDIAEGTNTIRFVLTDATLGKAGFRTMTLATQSAGEAVPTTERDLWMYYGRTYEKASHGHKDALNIGLHAFGIDLMPDLGYPRFADENDKHRRSLVGNTTAHNTVMVNNTQQTGQIVGQPEHFDSTDFVKLFDVSDEAAYSGVTDQYRRTSAMIRIDEENSYVIDLFRVSGGNTHRYSFHGAETSGIETTGLDLIKQADADGNYVGTLAGSDQPYPDNCDVEDLTGARYFFNIDTQEGEIGSFTADYSILDTWNVLGEGTSMPTDIHLKLTMLGDFDKVTLADAKPPENKPGNPSALRYVFAERSGVDLDSCFTAVIEPYRGESNIASIEALTVMDGASEASDMDVRAVKVTLTNGRVDYIINALDESKEYTVVDGDVTIPFQGFFGVYSKDSEDSETSRYYLNDGTRIADATNEGVAAVTGTVTDFTKELAVENTITIQANEAVDPADLAGKYIYIENDGTYNAAYRIISASEGGNGSIILDIGDVTPIRGYVDSNDFNQGFVYDITEGKAFQIPLSANNNLAPSAVALSYDTVINTGGGNDLVGTFTVTDPDDSEWTISLPAEEENFKIIGNSLYLAKSVAAGEYAVEVTVEDSAGNKLVQEFTVTVENKTPSGEEEEVPPNSPRPGKDEEDDTISFTDLPDDHWAAEAILALAEDGIIAGYVDDTVRPGNNATRAEFTSMMSRLLGLRGVGELPFADTDENAWYAEDVSAAVAEGLVVGWDGNFRPDETITREEAMVIVAKAIERYGVEPVGDLSCLEAFSDAGQISDWAAEFAATLVSNGIIVGFDGEIMPKANITRAEIAVILYQMKTKYSI